jgi:ABC-type polysaccharide/polyol phosphate transport system ATPase subunit
LDSLGKICGRTLWLDHGKFRMIGPTSEVVAAYRKTMDQSTASKTASSDLMPAA